MKFRKVDVHLQRRVLDYYEHRYQHKLFNEMTILGEANMSAPLKNVSESQMMQIWHCSRSNSWPLSLPDWHI